VSQTAGPEPRAGTNFRAAICNCVTRASELTTRKYGPAGNAVPAGPICGSLSALRGLS